MSEGFKGFSKTEDDTQLKVYIKNREVDKLIKQYKKLKKYTKSNLFQIQKLSGQETIIDKLTREFEENPEL